MQFRKALLTTHLWAGLLAAPFLLALGLTGAVMVFENEIDDALNAKLTRVTSSGAALSLAALESRIDSAYPGYRLVGAEFPADERHAYAIAAAAPGGRDGADLFVDQHTGRILGTASEARPVMQSLHGFHTHLLAGRTGAAILGWGSLLLVFLSVSGLILWWPAKVVRVRWGAPAKRLVFDLHNAVGAVSFVFLLVFAVTGAVIHWDVPAGQWLARLTRTAPMPAIPRAAQDCRDQASLPADRLLATAAAAVPGARATWLQTPGGPSPVRVVFKYPEDHTPAGRTQVFLAGCTGRLLAVRSSRLAPAAIQYSSMWNREIHTGDLFGWPTRILMCLFSLSLPVMAVTGPLIWWTRRGRGLPG